MADQRDDKHDEDELDQIPDRRRPGRVEYANSHLIALLRRPVSRASHPDEEDKTQDALIESDRADDLRPVVGVAVSVAIAVLLWVALIWVARKL